jgi:O-methyltransferase
MGRLRAMIRDLVRPELVGPRERYKKSDELDKFQHILEAVNYVRVAELPANYFEFGCHSGRTFSAALGAAKYLNMKFDAYAFDSFEGLPKTSKSVDGIFREGSFSTSLQDFREIVRKQTKVDLTERQCIKGFYEDSLTEDLHEQLPKKIGMLHIDVDLYSSTKVLLEFVKEHLVNGTVVLFDDWFCFPPGKNMGEKKALEEFLVKYPQFQFSEWKNYSTFGKSFFVQILD